MHRVIFGLFLMLGLAVPLAVIPPAHAGSPSLSVTPAIQAVASGAPFSITIVQDAGLATSGAQADMAFDPALVHVVSVEKGTAYSSASLVIGIAPQTTQEAIDEANSTGTLENISAFYLPGAGSVPSGANDFVVVNMEALGAGGTSPVTISAAEMLDANGDSVAVGVTGGSVTVGGASALVWGDSNCSGAVNSVDALVLLRSGAGLPYSSAQGCPAIGAPADTRIWGDVNCGGTVNSVDALVLLRSGAGLPYSSAQGCPAIGDVYP